jgi:phosphatidyl-myo-inositol dimannoside synthase
VNVLVVTNDFPPRIGGIEEYVAEYVRHLPPDISATVLTSRHRDAASFDRSFQARVIRWAPYPLVPTPALARTVVELIASQHVDALVFGATLPLAAIAGVVRRRTGVAIVMCTHGVEPAIAAVPAGSALLRRIARHATTMTVISSWSEQLIRSAVGPTAPIIRLPGGVDPERFHPDANGGPARRGYRVGDGPVILSVGRLVTRKGHDRLIAALPRVTREFPDARLLIVGAGAGRRRLEQFAAHCGVARHVVFAGVVAAADLPSCFAAADIFAMPCRSRWGGLDTEGLGTVYLQAAAAGLPAIAGSAGGAPEAVLDGVTGLVVDSRETAPVEAALLRLLRRPDERHAFGAAAAARVRREFTWAILARRFESILRDAGRLWRSSSAS